MKELLKIVFKAISILIFETTNIKKNEVDINSKDFKSSSFLIFITILALAVFAAGEAIVIFQISERNMLLTEKIEVGCEPPSPPDPPDSPGMPGLHVPREATRLNLKNAHSLNAMEKGP